jgi:hypothetical protein
MLFARSAKPAAKHVEAGWRHAHLAGVAELGGNGLVEHRLHIHVVEHQHRRVAAQFHGRALHAGGGQLRQLLAHRYRTGEMHAADDGRGNEVLRDFRRHTEDHLHRTGRHAGIQQCLRNGQRAGGGFFGGFQDGAAARAQWSTQLACGIAERKIPRCETCDRAHWFLHYGHAHAGHALRQHAAVGATAFFRVPGEDLRRHGHFDAGLRQCLAHLHGGHARQRLAAFAQQVRGLVQDLAARLRPQRAPHWPRLAGGLECAIQIGGAGQRQLPQRLPRGGIHDGNRAAAGSAEPLAVDEQVQVGIGHRCV